MFLRALDLLFALETYLALVARLMEPANCYTRGCILTISIILSPIVYGDATDSGDSAAAVIKLVPGEPALASDFLESSNARIGQIRVLNENIFDGSDPKESRTLHRWANALHIKTRPEVIETQLLFQPGDTFDAQVIEETERLLRSNRYLRDADIQARSYGDGVVDLDVRTTDVWTLNPSISFGRGGGKNSGGIGLKEYNLMGRGTSIGVGYKSNVDRDTTTFRYFDRNLFGSRYQLATDYANASDGFTQKFDLERPFFKLDARRAGGVSFASGRQTESMYDRGDITSQFEHRFAQHNAYFGWSKGLEGNWTRRFLTGLSYQLHEFGAPPESVYATSALPSDRRFLYPFLGVELVQNDFVTTKNFDQMNRTEDRHLGKRLSFRIGYASKSAGSTDNAWLMSGQFSNTLLRSANRTLVFDANFRGRIENGASRNLRLDLSSRYDRRQSDKRLFHASISTTLGRNLDIEDPNYLGGDNGLRGYPLRYQGGDKSVLVSLEQRFFTDWYPWRMFNIGGAVFFDAGRTWGADTAFGQNLGWLRDVGMGLRIGNTRSGVGRMIHIDVAYPLDGESGISNVQFLVEAKKSF